MKNQNGFVPIILIIATLIVGAAIGVGAFVVTKRFVKQPTLTASASPLPTDAYARPRPTPPPVPTPGSILPSENPFTVVGKITINVSTDKTLAVTKQLDSSMFGTTVTVTIGSMLLLGSSLNDADGFDIVQTDVVLVRPEGTFNVPKDDWAALIAKRPGQAQIIFTKLQPFLSAPNPSGTDHKLCQTNADCSVNQQCVTAGPIRAGAGKTSYCYNNGEGVPD